MRRCLIVVTACFALSLSGFAQQNAVDAPATKADIERYLQTMHVHEMMQQMVDAMAVPMHKMVHEQYEKDKDKLPADFEARMNKQMDEMVSDMPWDEMIDAMVPTYQRHLTKGDVDALVAFYSSPTGQKIIREMPSMMAEAMETMMPIMRNRMDRTTQRVKREMAAMLKEAEINKGQPSGKKAKVLVLQPTPSDKQQ